ncbi:MAG: DUF1731 domain-containing protein [Flavobacteriales bacterium]|nr:DUF1731 domain-containing protein [Flavobacteriales bacterium]
MQFRIRKPLFMPNVPAFICKILFGEMADVFLNGSRVSSDNIVTSGFDHKSPSLELALKDLFEN